MSGAVKYRSLKASAKTGAFKLISNMCDLFEAKPIYHGDTKKIDIVPMNPFSEPEDGSLPDIADEKKSKVIELRYGNNVKNVTRTLNTENLVTKLYAYGAFGDKTSGYCGIDEWVHNEYILQLDDDVPAGKECVLEITNEATKITWKRYFTPYEDLTAGTQVIWSVLDPASMSYVWNEDAEHAYPVYQKRTQDKPAATTLVETQSVTNYFSFLMDFDYYREVDLLTNEMIQTIAKYQRKMPELQRIVSEKATLFAEKLTELSEIVGSGNFCKLAISDYANNTGYLRLTLDRSKDPKGAIYRTDYTVRENKQFKWREAEKLKENGDPLNDAASIVYIIHDRNPLSYDTAYIKEIEWEEGDEKREKPVAFTLWLPFTEEYLENFSDNHVFLFASHTVNGRLGAYQTADEAAKAALESTTKVVTERHPVYFSPTTPDIAIENIQGYAWWWKYNNTGAPSEMYFCYRYSDSSEYASRITEGDTRWYRMHFDNTFPLAAAKDYFYNWKEAVLYRLNTDNEWVKYNERSSAEDRMVAKLGSIFRSCQTRDALYNGEYRYYTVKLDTDLPVGNYAFADDYGNYYAFTTKTPLTANDKLVYDTTERWVIATAKSNHVEDMTKEEIIDMTLEAKDYRFDNVYMHAANVVGRTVWEPGALDIIEGATVETEDSEKYRSGFCPVYSNIKYQISGLAGNIDVYTYTINRTFQDHRVINAVNGTMTTPNNCRFMRFVYNPTANNYMPSDIQKYLNVAALSKDNAFVVDEKEYLILPQPSVGSGELKGIIPLTGKFLATADEAFLSAKVIMEQAQAHVKELESRLVNDLGEMYREGYWQKSDYVDGDEEKLYNDALENLEEIAFPEAKYQVGYLDLYGTEQPDFGVTELTSDVLWPDISIDYAVHLIDDEIGISKWAFIDKLSKCYDQPWKTTLTLNTKLSTIGQHSFTDVMTHIAEVANQVKGKIEIYNRAEVVNSTGQVAAEILEGTIDANRLMITGGSSTWYTDDRGNLMFQSADGKSAMAITGNGFAIANSKDEWGDWVWRTFGTGDGFSADMIVTGFM